MTKNPEKTLATKNRITDAFFSLLEEKPINKIRIIDITKIAECNRSTFYEYFEDIYAVLEYGEQRIIESVRAAGQNNLIAGGTDLIQSIGNVYIENGSYICTLLGENGDSNFLSKFKNMLYKEFLDKQHIEDSPRTELVYEYSLSGLIMAFRWWYMNQDKCSLEEFISTMQSTIMNGTLHVLNN